MSHFVFTNWHLVFPFLGYKIAPNLASLAETSSNFSKQCRKLYCQHCGLILNPWDKDFTIISTTGRAAHLDSCEWLDIMDPFRNFYECIPWEHAFIAGGWACWLHFKEHRLHINPWRKNGPVAEQDLDVFFYRRDPQLAYEFWTTLSMEHKTNKYILKKRIKSNSKWLNSDNHIRTDFNTFCDLKGIFSLKDNPSHLIHVDFLSEHMKIVWPEDTISILELFDQPCCRVSFTIDFETKSKIWVVHDSHTKVLQPPSPMLDLSLPIFERSERPKKRFEKYVKRGYANLKCNCDKPILKSRKRNAKEENRMRQAYTFTRQKIEESMFIPNAMN